MGYEWAVERPLSLPEHVFGRYEPVLPGDPSFICQAQECEALCCRALSVPLGEQDVKRMERLSGLAPARFLECEDGDPIALPLADPYLLAREEGRCILLRADLSCGYYDGRPDACRAYPFQLIFVDGATGRPRQIDASAAVQALSGAGDAGTRPVLLRHRDCPGFTGPPIDHDAWRRTASETARLRRGT